MLDLSRHILRREGIQECKGNPENKRDCPEWDKSGRLQESVPKSKWHGYSAESCEDNRKGQTICETVAFSNGK